MDNPLLIFTAAFTFHLFADTLLHWNIFTKEYLRYPTVLVALDVIGGLAAAWSIAGNELFSLPLLAAIAGGNAPDILHSLWEMTGKRVETTPLNWKTAFFHFHDKLQKETHSVSHGLIWQLMLIAIAAALTL